MSLLIIGVLIYVIISYLYYRVAVCDCGHTLLSYHLLFLISMLFIWIFIIIAIIYFIWLKYVSPQLRKLITIDFYDEYSNHWIEDESGWISVYDKKGNFKKWLVLKSWRDKHFKGKKVKESIPFLKI